MAICLKRAVLAIARNVAGRLINGPVNGFHLHDILGDFCSRVEIWLHLVDAVRLEKLMEIQCAMSTVVGVKVKDIDATDIESRLLKDVGLESNIKIMFFFHRGASLDLIDFISVIDGMKEVNGAE